MPTISPVLSPELLEFGVGAGWGVGEGVSINVGEGVSIIVGEVG